MSNEDLLAQMQALIAPLQAKVEALEEENNDLKERSEGGGGGSIANTAGKQVNMRAARSVFIATKPVQDSPEDPRWAGRIADATVRSVKES